MGYEDIYNRQQVIKAVLLPIKVARYLSRHNKILDCINNNSTAYKGTLNIPNYQKNVTVNNYYNMKMQRGD